MEEMVFINTQMNKGLKDQFVEEAWKRRLTTSELIRLLIKKFLVDGQTTPATAQPEQKQEDGR